MIRTYSDLVKLKTFDERFDYLKLTGVIGEDTFGFDRYLNQNFYKSSEWKTLRNHIIVRDFGCDLGVKDYEIFGKILIHHMNPITTKDIINRSEYLLDPEYLICVSYSTHNALHYGNEKPNNNVLITRTQNDTCPWRLR